MKLSAFLAYIARHRARFGVLFDQDDTLTPSLPHWAKKLEKRFDISIDTTNLTSVPQLYESLPDGERREEIEAWLTESFQTEDHYTDLPAIEGVGEAVSELRRMEGEVFGVLTARREHLRRITETQVHSILGAIPVLMRPNEMEWNDTYAWKAAILSHCWPRVQGIVEDNPLIIPALERHNYQGTVWLYRGTPPPSSTIRVVPCRTHNEAVADMVKLIASQR